jgi:hypothetical protein
VGACAALAARFGLDTFGAFVAFGVCFGSDLGFNRVATDGIPVSQPAERLRACVGPDDKIGSTRIEIVHL